MVLTIAALFITQSGASASEVTLDKATLTPMPVNPGDPIKFQLTYRCIAIADNCDNATIVDQLPAEFSWNAGDVTWAYDTGSGHIQDIAFDSGTGQITVQFNNAPQFEGGSSGTILVYATFDTGVADGTVATNTATFEADNASPVTASSTATVSSPTAPDISVSKLAQSLWASIGDEASWTLGVKNTGGTTVDSVVLEDVIDPTFLNVTQFDLGTTGSTPGADIGVLFQYATVSNPTLQSAGPSTLLDTQQTIYTADLGLAPGDQITRIVLTYYNLPIGFEQVGSDGERPTVYGTIIDFPTGGRLENCVTGTGTDDGVEFETSSQCSPIYDQPVQAAHLTKSVDQSIATAGSVVTYTLKAGTIDGSVPMENAIVVDLLPVDVEYAVGSWAYDDQGWGVAAPTLEVIADYHGTGQTLLKWTFTDPLPAGEDVKITFDALLTDAIAVDQPAENLSAVYNTAPDGVRSIILGRGCESPRYDSSADLDDNGQVGDRVNQTGQALCTAAATITPVAADPAALSSVKWVKGQLDTDFSRYPDVGETVAGGYFDYELRVDNVGTDAVENLVYIDILPFVGDVGVLDTQLRDTEWKPSLISGVEAVDPVTGLVDPNVTVYYSTVSDICRSELGYDPAGCNDPQWTTTLPAQITSVTALKFDFGATVLLPGEQRTLTWRMRAPTNTAAGAIAWNSFAYSADTVTNGTNLTAEPLKVGIRVNDPSPGIYGDYVWLDANADGSQDEGAQVGVNDVRVDLYSPGPDGVPGGGDDVLVDYTYTSDDAAGNAGYYLFPNLDVGDYFAVFSPPDGYNVSPPMSLVSTTRWTATAFRVSADIPGM
ncbi:MAG: hypothetical protein H6512_04670 [Acidimicrobiia bacterium]|nr:hypothetical protein [Acidimicrobiia bacterium]